MHLAASICACLRGFSQQLIPISLHIRQVSKSQGMFFACANHRTALYDNHEEVGKGCICQISDKTRNSISNENIFLLAFTKAPFAFAKSLLT